MKKILLLIITLVITQFAYAQRSLPNGGGIGETVVITDVYGNLGWDVIVSSLTFPAPFSVTSNTVTIPAATIAVDGYLRAIDWEDFDSKVSSVGGSAGTGISLAGLPITSSGTFTVTNTAPDQTVVLNDGTGISITGTYPTFTVASTVVSENLSNTVLTQSIANSQYNMSGTQTLLFNNSGSGRIDIQSDFGVIGDVNLWDDVFYNNSAGTNPCGRVNGTLGTFSFGTNTLVGSAVVAINSTDKGFLPPRMTTVQRDAISTPAEGLEIYNLDTNKPNYYNGTVWTTPAESGVCGVSDAAGAFTYYADLTTAIAAASSGDVVEVFANITETGAVTIVFKDGVNINGNGYTYTLSNATTINAFEVAASANQESSCINLDVIRSVGLGSAIKTGLNSTGKIDFSGSTFTGGTSSTTGSLSGGIDISNIYCYNLSSGFGIDWRSSGVIINSHGESDSGRGFFSASSGPAITCTGVSDSGIGFSTNTNTSLGCTGNSNTGAGFQQENLSISFGCIGASISGVGFNLNNSTAYSPTGNSVSSTGLSINNGSLYSPIGVSSSGVGFILNNGATYNIMSTSTSNIAVIGVNGSINGGTIECKWNNAGGSGVVGSAGAIIGDLTNVHIILSNASAEYLDNNGIAAVINQVKNSFTGGTAPNVNITNGVTATADNQGNIFY
jgi:hypothetical protein